MSRTAHRALGALLVLPLFGSVHATGSNVVINSEQRAAGAVMTAFRLGDEVPASLAVLTYTAKDYTERTLRVLEEATTPAALKRARNGLLVNCPAAGTVRARLSRDNVLELDWSGCGFDISGWRHLLTGPGKVALCSDDFTPDYVYALSVGDSRRNLVETFELNGESQGFENRVERNVRLSGLIRLGRPTTDHNFDGNFSQVVGGFVHSHSKIRVGVPGEVYQFSESRYTAEDANVSGILEYGDLGWQEDIRLKSGKFAIWILHGAIGDQPEFEIASGVRGNNLRVRNAGDYTQGSESYLISGAANYSWPQEMSCASGGYSFTTRVPLVHPPEFQGGVDSWNVGELSINGAATARFSANADPSELGEMHIDLDVRRVGAFGYDGNSLYETGLPAAAQCTN